MKINHVLAFLLILGTLLFFNSKFYYHTIRHQPHPSEIAQQKRLAQKETPVEKASIDTAATPTKSAPSMDISQSLADTDMVERDTIWIETDKLICGIDEKGGRIITIKTKEYFSHTTGKKEEHIELLSNTLVGGANLSLNDVNFDTRMFFTNDSIDTVVIKGTDSASISLICKDAEYGFIEKRFTFKGNKYSIGYTVASPNLSEKRVSVGWQSGIHETEAAVNKMAPTAAKTIHYMYENTVEHILEKKSGTRDESGSYKWVGLTSKYFLIALIPIHTTNADIKIEAYEEPVKESEKKQKSSLNYKFSISRTVEQNSDTYLIYVGPTKISNLKAEAVGLQKVLYKGYRWFFFADYWFPPLCELVLELLILLQKWVIDYGVVIIILTIMLRIITFPLTYSSMKSMSRMKDLQPKIAALRAKLKNNPKKMNEQMMALYKKEGVNPFNPGCMPIIIQMPIFISLYIVLNKAIELRGATTFLLPWVHDLSKPESILKLPFEIPMYGDSIAFLPIVMAVLTYFQTKATTKDPNQQMMIYMMPIMMLVLFNNFPAGLVLYWTFSSAVQLVQQFYMDRRKKTVQPLV
jgi:YidC/Oxa1 family membrane protein insertase